MSFSAFARLAAVAYRSTADTTNAPALAVEAAAEPVAEAPDAVPEGDAADGEDEPPDDVEPDEPPADAVDPDPCVPPEGDAGPTGMEPIGRTDDMTLAFRVRVPPGWPMGS